MQRTGRYVILFVALVLLQTLLLDNLSISIYLCPLVYVAFLLLLPIEVLPVSVLAYALGLGIVMDWTMGPAGINTIATLPLAVIRIPLLRAIIGVTGRDVIREGGIPSPVRLGRTVFVRYVIAMVALHHLTFFVFEALSWSQIWQTLLRLIISGTVSVLFIWPIAQIFTMKPHKK